MEGQYLVVSDTLVDYNPSPKSSVAFSMAELVNAGVLV